LKSWKSLQQSSP